MASLHNFGMIAAVAGTVWLAGAVNAQAPSAATPPTPNPSAAAPMQRTPTPTPGSAIPNPSAPTTNPSVAAPQPPGSTALQNPNLAASPIQMPSSIPSKSETAPSAFDKLATSGATFVTKQEADRLEGFDRAFSEADRDKDGKLSKDEFMTAWAIYTGRT